MLTTLVTLLQVDLFFRLDSLRFGDRRINRKALVLSLLIIWLLFVLGREFGGHGPGLLPLLLEVISMQWMGSVFLLSIAFLMSDLVCGFGFFFRKQKGHIRAGALALGVLMVIVAHVQGLRAPVVERYAVFMEGLPADLDGTTVAVMSDFHAGEMGIDADWLSARVDQANRLKPDMVLLAGDLFERGSNPEEMIPVMRKLKATFGIYAVRGNHDRRRSSRRDVTAEILKGAGIPLLENRWVSVKAGLVIAGVEDLTMSRRHGQDGEKSLEAALVGRPDAPTILLSHTPLHLEEAAAMGVNLMVFGHTHGGQIWPFNYLVGLVYPVVSGEAEIDGMTVIVGRGTGTWGPRMRLWLPGEISLIMLRSGQVANKETGRYRLQETES